MTMSLCSKQKRFKSVKYIRRYVKRAIWKTKTKNCLHTLTNPLATTWRVIGLSTRSIKKHRDRYEKLQTSAVDNIRASRRQSRKRLEQAQAHVNRQVQQRTQFIRCQAAPMTKNVSINHNFFQIIFPKPVSSVFILRSQKLWRMKKQIQKADPDWVSQYPKCFICNKGTKYESRRKVQVRTVERSEKIINDIRRWATEEDNDIELLR